MRLQHFGHGRCRGLLGLLDGGLGRPVQFFQRSRDRLFGGFGDAQGAFLHLPERSRDRGGRVQARIVDLPGDIVALVHHRLGEDEALGVDCLHRLVGDPADFTGELLALVGQRHNQPVRLFVEYSGHVVDALRHGAVDLVGLADNVARNLGAHPDQFAFGLVGAAADCFGGRQRALGKDVGGVCSGFADRIARRRGALGDRVAERAGAAIE